MANKEKQQKAIERIISLEDSVRDIREVLMMHGNRAVKLETAVEDLANEVGIDTGVHVPRPDENVAR